MLNKAMERKLESGECLDVNEEGVIIAGWPGHFTLRDFVDGKDYCDAKNEAWVWSIGKHKGTGTIVASLAADLYQNPHFECVFLR